MMGVHVRACGPDDATAVAGVHALSAGKPASNAVTEREQRTWDRMMQSGELTVYLAEIDGRVVGTATLMLMPNLTYDCAPTAFVEAVVVVPEHRRKGVARTILGRLLDDARSAGCNKVQLLSHKRHAADGAHRLYETLGFEPEAEGFRTYLGDVPESVRAARGRAG
jgi:GNAT superfamily N-acetyltransferase